MTSSAILRSALPQLGQVQARDAADPLLAGVPATGAAPASAPRPRSRRLRPLPVRPSPAVRLVGLQRLERQLELLGLARQLLRGTAELGPSVTRQLEFQPGDLGLGGQRILRHRGDDALQRSEVVGQIVGRDRHAGSGSDLQPFWSK